MDWPFIAGSTFCWSPEFVVYIATGLPRVGPFDVTGLCGHSNLLKVCSKIIGMVYFKNSCLKILKSHSVLWKLDFILGMPRCLGQSKN